MRQILIDAYMDYINNYLTVERYAECNHLTTVEGLALIYLARRVYFAPDPDFLITPAQQSTENGRV